MKQGTNKKPKNKIGYYRRNTIQDFKILI